MIRTRIAPSPTGFMHIGTLRTVLFDYFLARQHQGQFIIRVEDTDQERLVPGAIEGLLRTFATLGIEYDEGPILLPDGTLGEKGAHGPYVQSQRLHLYRAVAQQLLDAGHAYVCFCSPQRLEEMRAQQTAAKQTPKYDRRCCGLAADVVAARIGAGEQHVIRMKIPQGEVAFDDAIRGKISFNLADVDDQILLKSDGFPSYHLAVVVDDHAMEISHVLRGEEWISSTPKQIVLHEMLGWTMPIYAHVPLILNPDKTKLSKRKGDVSVEGFLAKGYLPEALLNFISTLGFNPKADQEIYTREELVELFRLERVNKGGAVMNMEKLDWMNRQYLQKMEEAEFLRVAEGFVENLADPLCRRAALVERLRVDRLDALAAAIVPYVTATPPDATLLVWAKSDAADARTQLTDLVAVLAALPETEFSSPQLLEHALKQYIQDGGRQTGAVLWPLRIALSGQAQSAGPFEYLFVLGKTEALRRIAYARTLL